MATTVDWKSQAARAVVSSCIAKKRVTVTAGEKNYNQSLVEIYAEGAKELGCGIRELCKKVVEEEGEGGGGLTGGGGGGALTGATGVEALLASAGTLTTPNASGASRSSPSVVDSSLAILSKKLEKILEQNSSIIVDIRSNILKCNLSENYELMTMFFVNCEEIVKALDGMGGAKAPDFTLRIDLMSADGKKGVEIGGRGGGRGTSAGTTTTSTAK